MAFSRARISDFRESSWMRVVENKGRWQRWQQLHLALASFSCWRRCSSASKAGEAPPPTLSCVCGGKGGGGEPPNEGRSSAAAAAPPAAIGEAEPAAKGLLEGEGRAGREEEHMGQSWTRT